MEIIKAPPPPDLSEGPARWSVAVGAAVLALKFIAWRVTHSVALGSDAIESIVNVVAALTMWWALRISRRPADSDHPYGHGKAEYLSAVFEGALVLSAAVAIFREASSRLLHPMAVTSLGEGVAWSMTATACNAALGVFLVRRGRAQRSLALEADGTHVLTDVFTSAGVLAGLGVAKLTGWWVLDGLVAMLVAVNVVWVGWRLVRRAVGGLMDEVLDPSETEELRAEIELVARARGALAVESLRLRTAGAKGFCDLKMVVPPEMSVRVAHALCDEVEQAVAKTHAHVEVVIHVEPEVTHSVPI